MNDNEIRAVEKATDVLHAEIVTLRTSRASLRASCQTLLAMVKLKYGNLDPDVNNVVRIAEADIEATKL